MELSEDEKKYQSGTFVILKTDFPPKGENPLWKIDGKSLLRKYLPSENDGGKKMFKSTLTYSNWSLKDKDLYYVVPIGKMTQNGKEQVVEILEDKVVVDKIVAGGKKANGVKKGANKKQPNKKGATNEKKKKAVANEKEDISKPKAKRQKKN